jgi:hypothetical protein
VGRAAQNLWPMQSLLALMEQERWSPARKGG